MLLFTNANLLFVFAFALLTTTAAQAQWRTPNADNLVYLETEHGRIVIELNPRFAPHTVTQFRRLVRQGFYNGRRFYRVIDGFVAQAGDGSDLARQLTQPKLPAEFERRLSNETSNSDLHQFITAQTPDLFATATGFLDGFPVAHDDQQHYWLVHCPGIVAMARDTAIDSGSTDFYIVIGQAPRYLDRNLTIFGRVVVGMDVAQQIRRGPSAADGVIADPAQQSLIQQAHIAADLPKLAQLTLQVTDTQHADFIHLLNQRRHRQHAFFHHTPPAVLDVCQVPLATRVNPGTP